MLHQLLLSWLAQSRPKAKLLGCQIHCCLLLMLAIGKLNPEDKAKQVKGKYLLLHVCSRVNIHHCMCAPRVNTCHLMCAPRMNTRHCMCAPQTWKVLKSVHDLNLGLLLGYFVSFSIVFISIYNFKKNIKKIFKDQENGFPFLFWERISSWICCMLKWLWTLESPTLTSQVLGWLMYVSMLGWVSWKSWEAFIKYLYYQSETQHNNQSALQCLPLACMLLLAPHGKFKGAVAKHRCMFLTQTSHCVYTSLCGFTPLKLLVTKINKDFP